MTTQRRCRLQLISRSFVPLAFGLLGIVDSPRVAVQMTDDPTTFAYLLRLTGKFDEPSLDGFNFWLSSVTVDLFGRVGQWILGADPVRLDWELFGTLTLGLNL